MIKLLLVDDEEEFVRALAERLELRGFLPKVALKGEQALHLIAEGVADVMLLDLKMPGMDGCEVLRRVKRAYPHVQVVILTGHGSEKDEQTARQRGAFEYLRKPVDIEQLVVVLKKAHGAAGRKEG